MKNISAVVSSIEGDLNPITSEQNHVVSWFNSIYNDIHKKQYVEIKNPNFDPKFVDKSDPFNWFGDNNKADEYIIEERHEQAKKEGYWLENIDDNTTIFVTPKAKAKRTRLTKDNVTFLIDDGVSVGKFLIEIEIF